MTTEMPSPSARSANRRASPSTTRRAGKDCRARARHSSGPTPAGSPLVTARTGRDSREPALPASHQRIAHAQLGAGLGRYRGVRHDAGMFDQAFHAAETLGQREQFAALQKASGFGLAALEENREHAAAAAHLFFGQRMLRMTGQPRIN